MNGNWIEYDPAKPETVPTDTSKTLQACWTGETCGFQPETVWLPGWSALGPATLASLIRWRYLDIEHYTPPKPEMPDVVYIEFSADGKWPMLTYLELTTTVEHKYLRHDEHERIVAELQKEIDALMAEREEKTCTLVYHPGGDWYCSKCGHAKKMGYWMCNRVCPFCGRRIVREGE